MAEQWDEMAHAAAERRAARETRRMVVAERDQLLGVEHEMAWFRTVPGLAPIAEKQLAVLAQQKTNAEPQLFQTVQFENFSPPNLVIHSGIRSPRGELRERKRVVVPIVGRRVCGAMVAFNVRRTHDSLAFLLYDSLTAEPILRYVPQKYDTDRVDPEIYRLLNAMQERFRLDERELRRKQWESIAAIEVIEDRRLIVIAYHSNVLLQNSVLNLMALRYGNEEAILDRKLELVWKVVVEDEVTQPSVFMMTNGYSVYVMGCSRPFSLGTFSLVNGKLTHEISTNTIGLDGMDQSVTLRGLFRGPSEYSVYAQYLKYKRLDPERTEHVWATFLLPLDHQNPARVVLNPLSDMFRIVYEPEGCWLYYNAEQSDEDEAYIIFRPRDTSRRELVFFQPPDTPEVTYIGYLPETNVLLVIFDNHLIRSISLTRFHAQGFAPTRIADAPRRVSRAINTLVQIRDLEGLNTPVGLLPNELMFEIFRHL